MLESWRAGQVRDVYEDLTRMTLDIAARAPGRKESRPQRFLLSAGKIQQPDLPLATVGERAIGQASAIGRKAWVKVLGGAAGELFDVFTVHIHHIDVPIAAA